MCGIRRREFITVLGGLAAWPLAARAQQGDRVRRVGVLLQFPESDARAQANIAAFQQRLRDLGWLEGSNIRFDLRWAGNSPDPDLRRRFARELVALSP
jgi:putative ABC transport system substrate-binding protein